MDEAEEMASMTRALDLADDVPDVIAGTGMSMSGLHAAIVNQRMGMVAALLAHPKTRSLVHAKDSVGATPLHRAMALAGGDRLVRTLVDVYHADIKACDFGGDTPLHWAALGGRASVDTLQFLVDEGADATAKNKQGFTPRELATAAAHVTFFQSIAPATSQRS